MDTHTHVHVAATLNASTVSIATEEAVASLVGGTFILREKRENQFATPSLFVARNVQSIHLSFFPSTASAY